MEIGVSTACYYPMLTEKSLAEVGKSNIKTTEVFFNAISELEPAFINELKAIKDNYGIDIVSIHPTMSLAESFMLFSAYDRRKTEGLDWFKRYGEICNELGAKYIILHGGKPNGILDDRQYCERFYEIAEASRKNGGNLLQENVVNFRAGNLRFLKTMLKELGNDAAFCLDIKQCVRGGYSPFDVVESLKGAVKHIHISDHTSLKDCLLPGDGDFDFDGLFDKLNEVGYSGKGMIEVYREAYGDYSELSKKATVFINKRLNL